MTMCLSAIAAAIALAFALPAQAASYSYHGELLDGDVPADGKYDLSVRSFADPGARKSLAPATELPAVTVIDGRFSVELDLPEDADGTSWVEVAVRKSGSDDEYETLGAPMAVVKGSASCPGAWALDGNSGVPAGSFLGTVDATAMLEIRSNGRRIGRFDSPFIAGDIEAPRIVFGASANTAAGNGSTVSGGGATHDGDTGSPSLDPRRLNRAVGAFSTVAGGEGNTAGGPGATVAGGTRNRAEGIGSTVAGGHGNCAGGDGSWAGGTRARVRAPVGTTGNDSLDNCNADSISSDANGDEGTFVWSDQSGGPGQLFSSSGPNQFLIRADGGVGINTTTFGNAADLRQSELVIRNGSANPHTDLTLLTSNNRGYGLAVVPGAAGAAGDFYIAETDARTGTVGFFNRFRIDAAGTTFVQGGAVGNLSDARLKKNIGPIDAPLETLLSLHGQVFEYSDPAESMNAPGLRMGFIAQDVQRAIPGWVQPTGAQGHLAVTPIGFEALAVEAIRDLKAEHDVRIEHLQQENTMLRSALDEVIARLERIESSRGARK